MMSINPQSYCFEGVSLFHMTHVNISQFHQIQGVLLSSFSPTHLSLALFLLALYIGVRTGSIIELHFPCSFAS